MVFRLGNRAGLIVAAALVTLTLAPPAAAWTWPVDGPVLRPFVDGGDPYAGGQHRRRLPQQGRCLTVRTEDGYSVTLVHLGSIVVPVGTAVNEGDVVGTVGPSDEPEVPEPHVYLGIRLTADPNGYLDPCCFSQRGRRLPRHLRSVRLPRGPPFRLRHPSR